MKQMNVISSSVFFLHTTGDSCLEVPERLSLLPKEWFKNDYLEDYIVYEPFLRYVHKPGYVRYVKQKCDMVAPGEIVELYSGEKTLLCRDSYKVACFAAGYAVDALEDSLRGEPTFAVVRPPGHHAEAEYGKGFCIFNNMAVAAQLASIEHGKRVFIIDFDIHRGDGTQKIIKENNQIYHFSINQQGIYPDELMTRIPESPNITNIHLPPNASEDVHLDILLKKLKKALDSFEPDVIGFSAGFDSCYLDKGWLNQPDFNMGERYFSSLRGFAEETNLPYFAVLEGGYNPESVLFGIRAFSGLI